MWHRFGQPLRDLIRSALRHAEESGHPAAQPQDFFAAIARVPHCSAAQILRRPVAADRLEASNEPVAPVNALSAESFSLFEQAYEEAALLNDRQIGSDHLFLAMLRLNQPAGIGETGLSYAAVRRQV